MGVLFPDRRSRFHLGIVQAYYAADGRYDVLFFDGTTKPCRAIDPGFQCPLSERDTVLVVDSPGGHTIVGKLPMPVAPDVDSQRSLSQIIAQAEQDMKLFGDPAVGASNKPSFQKEKEHVPTFGDLLFRSRVSDALFGIFSDSSVLLKSANILYMGLLSKFRACVITCGRWIVNVIPGFVLKVYDIPKGAAPMVADEPEQTDEKVIRLEASLSSDPAKPSDRDVALEAGGLKEWDDTKTGASQKTKDQYITRGIRMKVRDFGLFESDNELGEMRVTYLKDPQQSPGLFQFRINEDEVVLSWGDQFMSLNKDGLFIKAKVIGLGGPWVMWDPSTVQTFTHDKSPAPLDPICEWTQGKGDPGILFKKSVYFGGDGKTHAYFGSKQEKAILESFLTEVYAKDMEVLSTHDHPFTTPYGPVLPNVNVGQQLIQDIVKVNTDVFIRS